MEQEWDGTHRPILVGVDGSKRNSSAVAWAAVEAANVGCQLTLVTAVEDHAIPIPHFSVRNQDERVNDMLREIREQVVRQVDEQQVRTSTVVGTPAEVLLDRSSDARMVVVGKRGLGGFARMIVGSTSIAVAGRAAVPVTIVPDGWDQEVHSGSPVVLGIDPYQPHHDPIHLAFSRAKRLGTALVAVHGWEAPTVYSWDAAELTSAMTELEQEAHTEFERVLDFWRARFPEVEVTSVKSHHHPAMAVLDAAENAQLVVLGKPTDRKLGGFAFGSVARAVLHYSTCPVTVVPAEET